MRSVGLLLLLPVGPADAHANALWPPAWWDSGGRSWLKFNQACAPSSFPGSPYCMWFQNNTVLPDGVEPTITDRDFTIATIAAPTILTAEEEEETEGEEEELEGEEAEGEESAEGEDEGSEESGEDEEEK